jgi:hypothetical protein
VNRLQVGHRLSRHGRPNANAIDDEQIHVIEIKGEFIHRQSWVKFLLLTRARLPCHRQCWNSCRDELAAGTKLEPSYFVNRQIAL